MDEWVLYTQPNYAHPKPTYLTPLPLDNGKASGVHGKQLIEEQDLQLVEPHVKQDYHCLEYIN